MIERKKSRGSEKQYKSDGVIVGVIVGVVGGVWRGGHR
jgi:hypothetical protein